MAKQRFVLDWKVPAGGYRWVNATWADTQGVEQTGLALVSAEVPAPDRTDSPPSDPGPLPVLFRLFADISPDEKGILEFATRFGNLWEGHELSIDRPGTRQHPAAARGVSLDTWRFHIVELRRLADLWDLIQRGDKEALASHIRWAQEVPDGPAVYFDRHPRSRPGKQPCPAPEGAGELIASNSSRREMLATFRPGDVLLPAKAYLGAQLDAFLFDAVREVPHAMSWDARREHPVLSYWCQTLMSAVWLQFAIVVNENLSYRRCRDCGTWFEVAPRAARASRQFCSTSCRSKAYRERQDRARQLYAGGKTIETIAEELDSDPTTVRKWITGFRE
jgi:hypothetical protein